MALTRTQKNKVLRKVLVKQIPKPVWWHIIGYTHEEGKIRSKDEYEIVHMPFLDAFGEGIDAYGKPAREVPLHDAFMNTINPVLKKVELVEEDDERERNGQTPNKSDIADIEEYEKDFPGGLRELTIHDLKQYASSPKVVEEMKDDESFDHCYYPGQEFRIPEILVPHGERHLDGIHKEPAYAGATWTRKKIVTCYCMDKPAPGERFRTRSMTKPSHPFIARIGGKYQHDRLEK